MLGPAFGYLGIAFLENTGLKRVYRFVIPMVVADTGWIISGIIALKLFPHYPLSGPPETVSISFIVPGICVGTIAITIIKKFRKTKTNQTKRRWTLGLVVSVMTLISIVIFHILYRDINIVEPVPQKVDFANVRVPQATDNYRQSFERFDDCFLRQVRFDVPYSALESAKSSIPCKLGQFSYPVYGSPKYAVSSLNDRFWYEAAFSTKHEGCKIEADRGEQEYMLDFTNEDKISVYIMEDGCDPE